MSHLYSNKIHLLFKYSYNLMLILFYSSVEKSSFTFFFFWFLSNIVNECRKAFIILYTTQ